MSPLKPRFISLSNPTVTYRPTSLELTYLATTELKITQRYTFAGLSTHKLIDWKALALISTEIDGSSDSSMIATRLPVHREGQYASAPLITSSL